MVNLRKHHTYLDDCHYLDPIEWSIVILEREGQTRC